MKIEIEEIDEIMRMQRENNRLLKAAVFGPTCVHCGYYNAKVEDPREFQCERCNKPNSRIAISQTYRIDMYRLRKPIKGGED